ncbi:MAG: polysaccharide ABC transporter ATP-binding protein [Thermodesulfobacteriota bacterium]
MAAPTLRIDGVSKKFCRALDRSLLYGVRDVVGELTGGRRHTDRLRKGEFWAVRDVGLRLERGEAIGLVGSNGAGKTTLLRMIGGLIRPDTGVIRIRGRVAPLIALGAGFDPVLSGRENIFANMAILGVPTPEIRERLDSVIAFAELDEAIDAPVQTYSSGMAARLGFACAVHTEPDLLLVDEVLAVGDARFRQKCFQRLAQLRERGTAFILVSHNPHAVLNVCERAVYLRAGELVCEGPTPDVLRRYEEDDFGATLGGDGRLDLPPKPETASIGVDVESVWLVGPDGETLRGPVTGRPATLCVRCKVRRPIADAAMTVIVNGMGGDAERVLHLMSSADRQPLPLAVGTAELRMHWPSCGLVPGIYGARILVREGMTPLDVVESFRFTVTSPEVIGRSLFHQPRTWSVVQVEVVPSAPRAAAGSRRP